MPLAVLGGILSGVVLPGLLGMAVVGGGAGMGFLGVPVAFAAGLVVHYQAVVVVRAIGTQPLLAEFLILALSLVAAIVGRFWRPATKALAREPPARALSVWWPWVALAFASNAHLLGVLGSHIPGVFEAWDAVVSWHRWAADWAAGRWPAYTYGYPQLVPVTWSGFYAWMGTDRAEFAARALMGAFPVLVTLVLMDAGMRGGRAAPWIAAAMWPVVLQALFADVIDSGYVDVPVTFFLLLTAALLTWVALGRLPTEAGLMAAGVAAAAAVLTKQAGWFALVFGGMFVWVWRRQAAAHLRTGLRALLGWALLALPSVIAAWWVMASGREPGNFTYVTSTIYGGENLWARLVRASTVTLGARVEAWVPMALAVGVVVVLALLACRERLGRWLWLGMVLPYYLCWALFFSYDLRNLLPAVPFFCLGVGAGLEAAWRVGLSGLAPGRLPRLGSGADEVTSNDPAGSPRLRHRALFRALRPGLGLAIAAAAVLASGLAFLPADRSAWLQAAHQQRLQAGDRELNRRLSNHLASHPPAGKILTTYALAAHTDGVREHVFTAPESPSPSAALVAAMRSGEDLCRLMSLTPRSGEISHLLLARGFLQQVVDQALARGAAIEELSTDDHRLLRLACPL